MWWNLLKLLDEENAAAFRASMRFHDESFLLVLRHVPLASLCFFTELESHRDEIEIMLKMPLHSFENSCEPRLICGYAGTWQTIVNCLTAHDSLVIYKAHGIDD